MNTPGLSQKVAEWDREYEANLSPDATMESRRPYGKILDSLLSVAALRFQPYRNDRLPNFLEKLQIWLWQFDNAAQPAAFLLASRILFVTLRQFEFLQRRLFHTFIRKHLLEAVIRQNGYARHEYHRASALLESEMDASLFVGNTDSSGLNSFVHLNMDVFRDRERRRLVGPELAFWTYSAVRAAAPGIDAAVRNAPEDFQSIVLSTDPRLANKRRLVVVEDFSGTGHDLVRSMSMLASSRLPIAEILVAPVIATARAMFCLRRIARKLTAHGPFTFHVLTAHVLPHSTRCFDGPEASYLSHSPLSDLSTQIKQLSSDVYAAKFADTLPADAKFGYGSLALAFAFFSNCPDNSLPCIWNEQPDWAALFPRASRYI